MNQPLRDTVQDTKGLLAHLGSRRPAFDMIEAEAGELRTFPRLQLANSALIAGLCMPKRGRHRTVSRCGMCLGSKSGRLR